MIVSDLVKRYENCPCGREHGCSIEAIYCESGLVTRVGEILKNHTFPEKLLFVADENTLNAAEGIIESLEGSGFELKRKIYKNLRVADIEQVNELCGLCGDVDGIISVGSGSLNDICRYSSRLEDKDFCIFATAPSMDGFASDTAPITEAGFKTSRQARQPRIILADTKILAAAPAELKSAGFGDMMAKYIGLVDWQVSHLLTGEYYCERVAALTRTATDKIASLAGRVRADDEETAGEIFSALVLTGLAMGFTKNSRPASGAEHIISHFWECKKLQRGQLSDFHGKKVGVATVMCSEIYHRLAKIPEISPVPDSPDWAYIRAVYGKGLGADMMKLNEPTVTDEVDVAVLKASWQEIRRIIKDTLPPHRELLQLMREAGAPVTADSIAVDPLLSKLGVEYHSYMRHRLTLMRLIPMLGDAANGIYDGI